jgi:hypothetical protein
MGGYRVSNCKFYVKFTVADPVGPGAGGCFWMYAVVSAAAFFIIRRYVEETGGKSLE